MAKYCAKCGTQLDDSASFCNNCGEATSGSQANQNATQNSTPVNINIQQQQTQAPSGEQKSKIAAGLLGILLGCFGVHNFYLGYSGKAVAQLLLTLIGWILCGMGPIVAAVWGLIEGIMILAGSITTDANGVQLKD